MKYILLSLLYIVALMSHACSHQTTDERRGARASFEAIALEYLPSEPMYHRLDSIEGLARALGDDSLQIAAMLYKAGYFSDTARPDSMDSVLRAAEQLLNLRNSEQAIYYYRLLAMHQSNQNDYAKAIETNIKALDIAKRDTSTIKPRSQVKLHIALATSLAAIGNTAEAQKHLDEAQTLLSDSVDIYTQAHFYRMYASFYEQAHEPAEVIPTAQRGLDLLEAESEEIPEKNILRIQQATALLNMYLNNKPLPIASADSIPRLYQKLITIEQEHLERPYLLSILYESVAQYYQHAGNYHEARRYLSEALAYAEKRAYIGELKELDLELSVQEGDSTSIEQRLQQLQAYIDTVRSPSPHHKSMAYQTISKAYHALGRHQEASRIKDSIALYNAEMREVEKAALAYNVKQNEELKKALAELEHERTNNTIYLLVCGLAILLVVAVLIALYRRFGGKQLTAAQQALDEGQREHDAPRQNKKVRLAPDKEQELLERLEQMMREEKIYLSQQVSLDNLSERLGTNRSYLSQAINIGIGCGFPEYVARFRIREAKRLLLSGAYKPSEVYREIGFGSTSAFYTTFKKLEQGLTPAEWLRLQRGQEDTTAE